MNIARARLALPFAVLVVASVGIACGPGRDPVDRGDDVIAGEGEGEDVIEEEEEEEEEEELECSKRRPKGRHKDALPPVDCVSTPVPTFAEVEPVLASCIGCHSSTLQTCSARLGAPFDADYDSYVAAAYAAEDGAEEVVEGEMPPGGGLTPAEVELFVRWALCGTPP